MKSVEEPVSSVHFNSLSDDSNVVRSYVNKLRQKAEKEVEPRHDVDLRDSSLIKFLRARDFDIDLSLKVGTTRLLNHHTLIELLCIWRTFKIFDVKS